ncbi:phage minor capsid protein [Nonomuraea lactucae]|uniref:phage minor capsid protein n=1 Tax=Nonomuraea lactucae TaxID=2249762 RepID=UPI000DE26166|nr:phage minor capsid protein [Nonomuraea lactucae]
MAVDQDLLDRIASSVADLYREVETALVRTVAQRLRADLDEQPQTVAFYQEKLDSVRKLQQSARLILASLQAARAGRIREAIARAYRSGSDAAIADLPERWFPKSGVGQQARRATAVMPNARVLENIAQALHRDVGRVDMNILRAPLDAYRAVQAGTAARVTSGAFTRREASQAAWQRLMDKGIVDFTDRAGRRWKLSSYVEMLARTNAQRAAVQGQTDRLADIDIDLVYVSDNVQECKVCRPFESKVLRRDVGPTGPIQVEHATRDDEYITVDVTDTLPGAMAKGLFHPNCRHSVSAYLPGVTTLKTGTADPEGNKARQKQRALERRIRAAKEAAVGALTPEAKKEAGARVRAAQAALRAHLAEHPKLKRLPYREQIGAGNLPKAGGPKGGPVTDLQPPVQEALPDTPDADAAAKAAAAQAAAEEKTRREAEAARKAAEEKARREAEERARAQAPGMRKAVRHRKNADGLAWAGDRLPMPDLTDAERQALRAYTGPEYMLVNDGLRGKLPDHQSIRDRFHQLLGGLDAAFRKAKAPESFIVHRGVGAQYAGFLGADVDRPETMKDLVGRTFPELGFMSTSVGARARFTGDVYLMIRVPKDHAAMNVMPVSGFGEDEREVLIRRNSRYVVHAVYKRYDGRAKRDAWFMELEIVPDDWEKPAGWAPDPYGDADDGYTDDGE